MRKELKEIEKKLTDNGWTLSVPARDDEMSEYVKNYNNGENVIGIEIALEPCSLGVYGHYGIGSIQIVKFEADMPYIRDDLRRMQQLITEAERDLIKAGIPFRPTYGFSNCLESLLRIRKTLVWIVLLMLPDLNMTFGMNQSIVRDNQ